MFNELLPAFFDELQANLKSLYDLFHGDVKLQWKKKLETLFRQIGKPITNDVTLTLLNTNFPIFSFCSLFLIWYKLCYTQNV